MMRVTIPQPALTHIVSTAAHGASVRSTQAIQQCVYLEATDDQLRAAATDLEYIGVEAVLPAEVVEPGAVAVPAKQLAAVLAKLPDAPVTLQGQENHALLTCGGVKLTLRGLSAEDWQTLAPPEQAETLALPVAELRGLFDQTLFAVSPDETRPILTGLLLEVRPDQLRAVATDTYRLVWRNSTPTTLPDTEHHLLLSGRFAGEVNRLLAAYDDHEAVLSYSDKLVAVTLPGLTLTSRLITGEFPNYEKIIPEVGDRTLKLEAAALRETLERVLLVAYLDSNRVVFRLGETVEVSAQGGYGSDAIEEVLADAYYTGEPLTVAVNGKFLLQGLTACGAETVRLDFTSELSPLLLRPEAGGLAWQYVVMPMQVIN